MADRSKIIVWSVVGVSCLALLFWGLYELGWLLKKENTQRQYEVNRTSQQFQAGLIARERDYVICVADNGDLYASYWEGFVQTEGGPAHWDAKTKQVVVDGVQAPLTNCAETPAACVAKD